VAGTGIASLLYHQTVYSPKVTQAIDLSATEIYVVVAALSVEVSCRLVDSASCLVAATGARLVPDESSVILVEHPNHFGGCSMVLREDRRGRGVEATSWIDGEMQIERSIRPLLQLGRPSARRDHLYQRWPLGNIFRGL
jgi:hypothetical protein